MDPVEVIFHPETYERFFKPMESSHPKLMTVLLEDFRRYQVSMRGDLPDYFGYDSEYGSPPEVAGCLEHIHLRIPPNTFPSNRKQIDRKCRKGDPENDVALVYTRNLMSPNRFCIIGILAPDAHKQSRNMPLMRYLGQLARQFQHED